MFEDPHLPGARTDEERAPGHRRNQLLEDHLGRLNDMLTTSAAPGGSPDHPTVFIVGNARSGSTLLMQWWAATGRVGYPSNLISRFWGRPAVGVLVQQMLADPALRFGDEFDDIHLTPAHDYTSTLGKTSGTLAPNEFWYWWRRFFEFESNHVLSDHALESGNWAGFTDEIREMAQAFQRPVVMKALLAFSHLEHLAACLPEAVFIHLHRDPAATMSSLRRSRTSFYGDESTWYSLRPADYERLKKLPVEQQLAHQVWDVTHAIGEQLSRLPASRRWLVRYEDFCADTIAAMSPVARAIGVDLESTSVPRTFAPSGRDLTTPSPTDGRAATAYQELCQQRGSPLPAAANEPDQPSA